MVYNFAVDVVDKGLFEVQDKTLVAVSVSVVLGSRGGGPIVACLAVLRETLEPYSSTYQRFIIIKLAQAI